MEPSMVAFLKIVFGRSKDAYKYLMSQQPSLKLVNHDGRGLRFFDMRRSIARAVTDAELKICIIVHNKPSHSTRIG